MTISTVMVVQGQVMNKINHDVNAIGDGDGRLWSSVCCTRWGLPLYFYKSEQASRQQASEQGSPKSIICTVYLVGCFSVLYQQLASSRTLQETKKL